MQALSEEDRRLWMEAMDGREPVGYHGYQFALSVSTRNKLQDYNEGTEWEKTSEEQKIHIFVPLS